jgi:predicted metal-dependent phosphoesterase TrpH/glycosyltransferase involved in cell wall biosynthesis
MEGTGRAKLDQQARRGPYPGGVIDPLTILQVTPHAWGTRHEVNHFVRRSSEELSARGHRVFIAAPATTRHAAREARAAIEAARNDPDTLLGVDHAPRLLQVGGRVTLPGGPRPRPAPVAVDASRSLETLLRTVPFDIVHVHEPFAPSLSSIGLRHSHSLNVGTFHEPSERLLSTQVARPLVEIFFGRLDARSVTCLQASELMERYFPGSYQLLRPGADAEPSRSDRPEGPLRILLCLEEERGALRLFLRALRRLPQDLDWEATVWTPSPSTTPLRIARRLRERIRLVGPAAGSQERLVADADVLCAASGGPIPAPQLIRMALAGGAVPLVSRLPIYAELLGDGELGLMFAPGDAQTLAGQITRLARDRTLLAELRERAGDAVPAWSKVSDQLEELYRLIVSRRQDARGDGAVHRRIARRKLIDVDLHMHTDHSPDCATPVEVLLETAQDRGLGAIAVTDHNEISGALEAREMARRLDGLQVIVAEEIKTAEQGEVIGLFIEERIAPGMTMAETIAKIRDQGGLVYVPHPFDRLHSVPDYEHLLEIVEEIDILEVFNPRVALTAFNEEAERFARKYRIVPGAGSDSHVAQGLGSVRVRIHDFEGPHEFLEAMRDADITRKHKNLIYVQALKFLQTTGRPKAARRKVANARPARGGKPRRPVRARSRPSRIGGGRGKS